MADVGHTGASNGRSKRAGRPRLYETLIEQLESHIAESGLHAGSRLPPERALAEQFGVSRVTLKQALIALEMGGRVEIRHGDGVFVTEPAGRSEQHPAIAERRRKLSDIIQARRIVEVEVAGLAAQNRTDQDLQVMFGYLTDGSKSTGEFVSSEQAIGQTLRFHSAIAAATHNAVLVDLVEHLVSPVTQLFDLHRAEQTKSKDEHLEIYRAVQRGDPVAAREIMAAHIDHFGQVQMPRL